MHALQHPLSPRVRFVLRRGVVPWGLPSGVGAALLVALGLRRGANAPSLLGTIVVCVICFALWTALVGWGVGGALWDIRRPDGDAGPKRLGRDRPE